MSEKRVLTKEIAEQFIEDEHSVDLSQFTEIHDDAAEILSRFKGGLILNGIIELSDAVAESLSRHECINLNNNEEATDQLGLPDSLIDALANGDIEKANLLKAKGYRIYSDKELFSRMLCFTLSETHISVLNSKQIDPDSLRKIVPIAEVIKKCGPLMDLGASVSVGDRPQGWGNFALEKRILSWRDDGFGLVGDQCNDVDIRLVAKKSLADFEDAIIAGPLGDEVIEEFIEPSFPVIWENAELVVEDLKIECFRRLFLTRQSVLKSLKWTHNFELNAYTKEAYRKCLTHKSASENLEILMAEACLFTAHGNPEFQDKLEDCFNKINQITSDASVMDSIQAFKSIFLCLMSENPLKLHDELRKLEKLSLGNDSIRCIHQIFLAWPWSKVSPSTAVSLCESSKPFMRQLENPYFSWLLEDLCHRLLRTMTYEVISLDTDENDFCETYALLVRNGLRDFAVPLLSKAISSDNLTLLEVMIEKKVHLGAHFLEDFCYLPIASAVIKSNVTAVRMLCENGADPLDKSHHEGLDSFECLHALIESDESNLSLQIPEGRQFGNEELEQLRMFIQDTKFDINNDYREIGKLLFSCHASLEDKKA